MPILRPVRVTGALLVPILTAAAIGLYGWPGSTERTFAWTIHPDLTPLVMGAGYASGVVFFLFVARGGRWLDVSFGFIGVSVFATLMAIATIIHWEKFNHSHASFFGWVALYAVTPLLVPALWVYNGGWSQRKRDSGEPLTPLGARIALGLIGGAAFVVGLAIFVQPSLAVDHWGWDVTPLTARVVGSFLALNVGWAAAALDGRWAAIRIPALSQLVGTLLLLGGLVRAWDDLHTGRVATWFYVGGAAAVLGLLVAVLLTMSFRSAQAPSPGT